MKIRFGFVSNSSTTSFICAICNEVKAGQDIDLEECGMFRCENGHEVHCGCVANGEEIEELLDEFEDKEGEDENGTPFYEYRYELPSKYCPICSFKDVSNTDFIKYIIKSSGRSKAEFTKEIKKRFGDYKNFTKFLDGRE